MSFEDYFLFKAPNYRSSTLTNGIGRSGQRALLYATGMDEEDLKKPFVAVIGSFSEMVPGHAHLRELAEAVCQGVIKGGGVPRRSETIAICDGLCQGHKGMCYPLASRDLIADSVEMVVEAHHFDAMVLLPGCDKIIPGMLMAAARVDIPAIVVPGGPMLPGNVGGNPLFCSSELREFPGRVEAGVITPEYMKGGGKAHPAHGGQLRPSGDGQFHVYAHRGAGHGAARLRHGPGGVQQAQAHRQGQRPGGDGAAAAGDHPPADSHPDDVLKTLESPQKAEGGIAVLWGNLAPRGAVVKQSGVRESMYRFTGRARVFDSMEEADAAVSAGSIEKGTVIVIRYEGPKGGPGMREMLSTTALIMGRGMDRDVALVTDGRFSGATHGPCIGHISPEAAAGGPIAFVKDGDVIHIDITNRTLTIDVTEEEFARRREGWTPVRKPRMTALAKYATLVSGADTGAVADRNRLD